MTRRIQPFSISFAFLLFANAAFAVQDANNTFEPEWVEEISPCCTSDEISDGLKPSSNGEPKYVIHNNAYDPETFRMLKEKAKTDPNVRQMKEEALSLAPSPGPAAPALGLKFVGNSFVETRSFNGGTTFFPPDTILAVGPNNVLEATNGMVRLSSKTNTNVQKIGLAAFFKRSGKFLFDPKVYFDLLSNRFIVVALERDLGAKVSAIVLAVSQSPNPSSLTSGWCLYRINSKVKNTWADFPSFGLNQSWFAVNVNNFDFSTSRYFKSFFRVISIKIMTNNANGCPKIKAFNFPRTEFNINPAQHYSSDSDDLFAINHFGPSNFYGLWRVTGTAKPQLIKGPLVMSLNPYSIPPDADQPGATPNLNTGDNKIMQLAFRNGVLNAVQTTGCNFGGFPNETCVRLLQIDPDLPAVTFESDLGAGSNKFVWNPSIVVNKRGDVTVAMQQSGSSLALSTAVSGKRVSGTKLEKLKRVMKGSCAIADLDSSGRNRTGDYTGANLDPTDELTVWIAGEFSKKTSEGCKWFTAIARTKYN